MARCCTASCRVFSARCMRSFDVDQELLADDVRIQAVERAGGLTSLRMTRASRFAAAVRGSAPADRSFGRTPAI